MQILPLSRLGAREEPAGSGTVHFGIFLPNVDPSRGALSVKVIHEDDQFLKAKQPAVFAMTHSVDPQYGDYWETEIQLTKPGRYVYRYVFRAPQREVDWIIDPFAREYGIGKLSAVTLGWTPRAWSAAEADWRTPRIEDLVVYELMIQEFGNTLEGAAERLPYLADLGVNCLEIMPLTNVAETLDWGFLPLAHFGVDERFGRRGDLQAFVEAAHAHGIAVVADVIYGHTGEDFAYEYAYRHLGLPNPFMGSFSADMFGPNTDWGRAYVRDFFFTANISWLEWFHLDGFRYDCVPNYWTADPRHGYGSLVHATYQHVKNWTRFAEPGGRVNVIQIAEQLEAPRAVVWDTYSNSTWQNETYEAAKSVAYGGDGAITRLGQALGLDGYPTVVTYNGTDTIAKAPLQYIENHDHERFITHFGRTGHSADFFAEGDRSQWYRLQPYLIALLLAKGVPLLWEGEELCESYWVPPAGKARIAILRPVRWNYFYDEAGRGTITLVRKLLALRRARPEFRGGAFHFHDEPQRYQERGVLLFSRWSGPSFSLVAVNFTGTDVTVPFWFPGGGPYTEQLHGEHDVPAQPPLTRTSLTVPGHYGRVWST